MDWTTVLAKLRKQDQKLWHQMVSAYDAHEWSEALRVGEQILKINPHHAGLCSYLIVSLLSSHTTIVIIDIPFMKCTQKHFY